MSPGPRDWDKELAEIDRIMGKKKAAGDPPAIQDAKGRTPAPKAKMGSSVAPTRRQALGTWGRVLLGGGLVLAAVRWPYLTTCGFPLAGYLGTLFLATGAGVWGAVSAWRRRMGRAHVMALAVILTGFTIALLAVLPRVGYAGGSATWLCP